MTIESDLQSIAIAVANIQNLLEELVAVKATQANRAPAVEPVPAPAAPAVPDFMREAAQAPAAPAAGPKAPFENGKELIDYCKSKYVDLGPVKGSQIQSILTAMGVANVPSLTADRYDEFFAKVEAL